jgi:hypothetical protein
VVVEVAVVVVVMGVGDSSGIGEGKGSGTNKANSGNSDGGGPYNNQLKDPAEEMTTVGEYSLPLFLDLQVAPLSAQP